MKVAKWIGLAVLVIAVACWWMWPRTLPRQALVFNTARCRNVKVALDDVVNQNPSFKPGKVIRIDGEMEVLDRPENVDEHFIVYLVSPHDPHGEVIENSNALKGSRTDTKIKFAGELDLRERLGDYELRITAFDEGETIEDHHLYFYRQPVRVAK